MRQSILRSLLLFLSAFTIVTLAHRHPGTNVFEPNGNFLGLKLDDDSNPHHVDNVPNKPETNAQRFARGLPPLPPRRKRSGTRSGAHRVVRQEAAQPSAGTNLGFRFRGLDGTPYTNKFSDYYQVALEPTGTGFYNLRVVAPVSPDIRYVGLLQEGAGSDFTGNSYTVLFIAHLTQGIQTDPVKQVPFASAVWTYDEGTRELTPHWFDNSGNPFTLNMYFGTKNGQPAAETSTMLNLNPSFYNKFTEFQWVQVKMFLEVV
ncbi:hypothetical protein FRB99_009011 [Tulasnella sp. 403]|nr:hypothetical protein FRB99_009011 [Tulasnella sp. 403]